MRPVTRMIPILALAVTAAACGNADSPRNSIAHPQGADEVILRIDMEGGFVMPTFALTHLPLFTLMGDGTIIVGGAQIDIFPSPALPPLVKRTVTEAGIQAILRQARDIGLMGEDQEFRNDMIADAGTTVFTIVQGNRTHTTKAYALSEGSDGDVKHLATFQADLTDLERWLPEGTVGPESIYDAPRMRLVIQDYVAPGEPEIKQPPKAWPLAADLGAAARTGFEAIRCTAIEGADLTTVLKEAKEANALTPWTSNGKKYLVAFRPLMPDEAECPGPAS